MTVVESQPFKVQQPAAATILRPFAVFEAQAHENGALIILNTPIDKIALRTLWKNSSVRICADGGANVLYDFFQKEQERQQYIPHYITGDCDLIREDVCSYYRTRGTAVVRQTCQYSTDFMKSLKIALLHCSGAEEAFAGPIDEINGLSTLMEAFSPSPKLSVCVAGGIGGRFDQSFHLINQLYVLRFQHPGIMIYFYLDGQVIFLARKGVNYVGYSSIKIINNKHDIPRCGLLPFRHRVILNTSGLQYDVKNWPSEVGGAVSSSNGVVGVDGFVIDTTDDIVMNIEVSVQDS